MGAELLAPRAKAAHRSMRGSLQTKILSPVLQKCPPLLKVQLPYIRSWLQLPKIRLPKEVSISQCGRRFLEKAEQVKCLSLDYITATKDGLRSVTLTLITAERVLDMQ